MVDPVSDRDYKTKVLTNRNLMQRVLENYSYKRLIEFRKFNKDMCKEVVPRCIKHLRYECTGENKPKGTPFYRDLSYASSVEILYING